METSLPEPSTPVKKAGYHHGDLRASIINAVAQLIGENKSLSFHLKDVAELVGTSQPAIYKHFEGKNALLVETAILGYELQKKFRDHALGQAIGSPLSKLLAIGHAYVNFSRAYPGYFLLMKNLETEEILSSKRYAAEQSHVLNLVSDLIQECVDDGVFLEIDAQLAITVLQSTAYGLAHLYITNQIDRIAHEHVDEPFFPALVFAMSVKSLLSASGMEDLREIQSQTPNTTGGNGQGNAE